MSELTFREDDHTYHWRGRRVPSVTELLHPVTNYGHYGNNAMELGTAVHEATALDDYGDLDEETVTPEVWPYLDAWRSFRRDHAPDGFNGIEMTVHDKDIGYAGTLDRCGEIVWPRGGERQFTILDIKTGAMRPWYGLQLLAYANAYAGKSMPLADIRAAVVNLQPNGTFAVYTIDITKPNLRLSLIALKHVWELKKEYGTLG